MITLRLLLCRNKKTNIFLDFSDSLINLIQRFFTTYDIIKDNNNSDG